MTSTRAPWLVTVLMALGTYFAMLALTTLVDGGGWLRTVAFVLVLVTAVSLIARALTRSRILPTVAALATAVLAMVPLFAVDEDGERTLRISGLWRALANGADFAATSPAPAHPTTELVALLTGFAVAIFIAADHLAASWRAVAVSGVVLLLPWTPGIFLQYQVPVWALFASAACWMLAMGVARSRAFAHRGAPLTGAAIATVAALATSVVVVPAALGANGWGAIPRINAPDSLETSTRLNLALDLRNSLTVNSEQVVITYVSTGIHPDAFRLYTFRNFDGSQWTREKAEPTDLMPADSGVLWPGQVSGWDDAEHQILSIKVSHLAERNLPVPPQPRSVDVDESWSYSPSRDEIATTGSGTKGLQYTVVAALGYFTAQGLQDAQAAIDAGGQSIGAEYTAVPSSVDLHRLQALAADITADATTQYAAAVAIQNYLRDGSNFTYDTTVSPDDRGDAVSTFLDDRRGYCVQFATTMVMLSRSLGIPARLAMGFLGGQPASDGTWQVRSGDAHTWPELYFPGQGWVRFEPTPAVQTGAAPAYTVERSDTGSAPIPSTVPIPTSVPNAPAIPTDPDVTSSDADEPGGVVSWWAVAALAIIAAGATAALAMRRRAATRSGLTGPEGAWAALRERLPEPLRWNLALTPLEAADGLARDLADAGTPLSAEGRSALGELRDAVSDHRYAPPGQDAPSHDWLHERVARVVAATRSRPDRVDAQSVPRRDP